MTSKTLLPLLVSMLILHGCAGSAPEADEILPGSASTKQPAPSPEALTPTTTPEPTVTPEPTATLKPACLESRGLLEEGSYAGRAVSGSVPYFVYLPPCYAIEERAYPSLYLLHGFPFDERHWLELGIVDAAENGFAAGSWPAAVIVMPLLPEPIFTGSDGGPGSYEAEFLEGLVPHIDGIYRTDGTRRGVAGISRGAIWALEIAFRNPQIIGATAALSPALAVNSARAEYDPFDLATATDLPWILLLAGDADWALAGTVRLSEALAASSPGHQMLVVSGDHTDATWANALGSVLDFFAAAWEGR